MKLTGRMAVVTGASKGIGAAIAKKLAAEGANVIVNYASSKDQADTVVNEILKNGGEAVAIQADFSKPGDITRFFAEVKTQVGRIDVLVNNAGIYEFLPLESVTEDHFRRHFDLNVLGLLLATKEAVALMAGEGGSIINISSTAAITPPANGSVYSGTKGAVDVITKSLAQELGGRKIRVNSLAPGTTDTEGLRITGTKERFESYALGRTPLGRIGEPEDIAKAVAFLASDDSGWITGEVVQVGGGLRF